MLRKTETRVETLPPAELQAQLTAGAAVLVDVRETREYELEHIAGALLLPLSSFDAELFPALPGKRLVLHCAIGKRSEAAAKMLLGEGHAGVAHLAGGLAAWKAAGLPTEEALEPPDAPAPVFHCPPPGLVLEAEYLTPLGLDAAALAAALHLPAHYLSLVISGERRVDAGLSLRLARYFSTAGDFWMQLQSEHDLERARHGEGEAIRRDIRPRIA